MCSFSPRDGYISVFSAHRMTGYSCRMLCHLIEIGELPAIRTGKRSWRIKLLDLQACLLRRMEQDKVRKQSVISALSELEFEESPARDLTWQRNSTIYSTGPRAVLKGETYDATQKSTEVDA